MQQFPANQALRIVATVRLDCNLLIQKSQNL
jgi:hypothetical protein